jgi:predicted nucleotidyltransferase
MVSMAQIRSLARQVGEQFRAQKVILFGSYAEGNANRNSDVDLFVVMPFRGRRVDQSVAIRMQLRPEFPLDLIIRSPSEVRQRLRIGDSFVRQIMDTGKVMYEADNR